MASAARPAQAGPAAPAMPTEAGDTALLPVSSPWLLAVGIMTATLLQILDTTIANVAIPHMQAALGTTPDEISWVLTSYIVASAVAMPTTGWLADRVGSRPLFLWSVAFFILTSMLCGIAQNLTEMVLFRGLQGIAGAFISPLSQAAMIDTNPPSKQARMIAIWGMGVMVGPILGPIVGGWLTENWNWRAVFYINVPTGILAFAILYALLPNRPIRRRPFDVFGFSCVGVMLASVQLLLDRGNQIDWFASMEAWIYSGLAISALWLAIVHFWSAKNPLFSRQLFADRMFLIANFLMFVMGMVMFATMVLLPPMLQHLFGYDVLTTGIVTMPRGIGVLASMQVTAWMLRKGVKPGTLVAAGFFVVAFSTYLMSGWSLDVDEYHIVSSGFIQGLGMGLAFIPLNTMAFSTLPPLMRTEGSSLFNLSRSMGSSIGISIVTTLLARNIQINHEELGGRVTMETLGNVDLSTVDQYQSLGTAALTAIDAEINRQAAMIAYIDNFYAMAILSIIAVPIVLIASRRS